MGKRIFITATNTDIGKTYTTKLLLKEFASRGIRVGVIKPIETGVVDSICLDGDQLLSCIKELNDEFINIKSVVPITYELPAAPYIASKNTPLNFKILDNKIQELEKLCDVLLIEGAGGLLVPIDENTMIIDLIKYFNASALLVTHCSLGCINDTLLSKKALDDMSIPNTIAFNCREHESSFSEISEPYFKNNGFKVMKVNQDIDKICDVLYNL